MPPATGRQAELSPAAQRALEPREHASAEVLVAREQRRLTRQMQAIAADL